jgi:hypothetical protein
MADTVRRDRDHTDPFPLRRVVRQRPLTEQELRAIYGYPYQGGGYQEYQEDAPPPAPPPGVVRPSDWGASEWDVAQVPPQAHWGAQPPVVVGDAYVDDELRIPIRRSRWGWAVVVAVVAAAGGLLAYAIADRSDVLASLQLTRPAVVFVNAGPPLDRAALALAPMAVKLELASAEPSVAAGAELAEPQPVAMPARRAPARPPAPPEPRPAVAPAASPYPDLTQGTSLDEVQQEIDSQLGIAPRAAPESESTAPAIDEPNDLKGLEEFEESAPARDNPYAEPEHAPQPEPEPPSDEIVRDPGF